MYLNSSSIIHGFIFLAADFFILDCIHVVGSRALASWAMIDDLVGIWFFLDGKIIKEASLVFFAANQKDEDIQL